MHSNRAPSPTSGISEPEFAVPRMRFRTILRYCNRTAGSVRKLQDSAGTYRLLL